MSQILLIDDDTELCDLLTKYLTGEGFVVHSCFEAHSGIKTALSQEFQAIVLDVMLPNMNGFEVLKKIREKSNIPVLMLTARGDDIDRIVGLEIGADDYLSKPCNPRELVARLRAIMRRSEQIAPPAKVIELGDLVIDSNKRAVSLSGEGLELTNAEYNILQLLTRSPGQAFSKEELTEHALGRKYTAFDRSIDVHISNLRNKLGNNDNGNPRIKTVRGFGYLYDA
jgi:two-component system response regulator CpxR